MTAVEELGGRYTIETRLFEGPADLLLHLVNSHQLDILDLELAPIVDEFVAYIGRLAEQAERAKSDPAEAVDVIHETRTGRPVATEAFMEMVSEFLLVAAILVELKSGRLLPGRETIDEDEEAGRWEERDLLLARLLECRAYAAVTDVFVAMAELAARSIPREVGLDEGFEVHAPDLLAGVTLERLAEAYLRATAERPAPRVDLSHVTVDVVTVSETVHILGESLPKRGRTTFRELTEGLETRAEIIVHFLALLELCKLGKVNLGQGRTFGELEVEWIADGYVAGEALAIDTYEG